MKTILIDGNNLIHKVLNLKTLFMKEKASSQIALVESVKSRLNKNEKVIFVFDGFGVIKQREIIYSNEVTADEVIRHRIEKFSDHKKLKVVSSDNDIINLAKVCGCEVQKSEEFWKDINSLNSVTAGKNINQNFIYNDLEKPERMSKREIDEFKKYFT